MNNIKAIVSDFDGTLIDQTHTLTPRVAASIRKFVDAGYIFSVATGRAYEGVLQGICHDLGLTNLHIVRGGSEILSGKTDEVVWGKYIDPSTVSEVITFLQDYNDLFIAAERGKYIYTRDGVGDPQFGEGAEFKSLTDMPTDHVPKIMTPPFNEEGIIVELVEKLINQFPNLHIVKTSSPEGIGLDINDGGAGKHLALLQYSKLMDLSPSEIIGVGDSYNDYPLLTACGVKVAMGNAPEELKEVADFVVGSQKEDGIAELIERVLGE
jgi:5-amino-6-(5-phospho-D-ribitylamino)uracil phosphatase